MKPATRRTTRSDPGPGEGRSAPGGGRAPGQLVARRYLLRERVGAGGFGAVWRAHDVKLDRDVALKLFDTARGVVGATACLRRELACLARVRHEGVVELLDCDRDGEVPVLVMEFVPGRTLDRVVAAVGAAAAVSRRGRLGADWCRAAARVTCSVLHALEAVHRAGVVHRDVKPSNVLLRPDGRAVLLDFGLAAVVGSPAPDTDHLFGTVDYMAPEQLRSLRIGRDRRTDVYQCGLLFYELLTLLPAHAGVARDCLPECVRAGRITPPRRVCRHVPRRLDAICMRALAPDPDRRYATAAAFRDDLESWLAGGPTSIDGAPPMRRAWRRCKRFVAVLMPLFGAARTLAAHAPGAVGIRLRRGLRLPLAARAPSAISR